MTKYTAEDFARAELARHEDGILAARTDPGATHPWAAGSEWASDAEMAADPGWSIVRDAESLTAREHLDSAWAKAHETDVIPAGVGCITKWGDGAFSADPSGFTRDRLAKFLDIERRLLDPPAPAWHRAQIIRARRDDDHDSMRWARMDSGRWVCLDGESAGIECEPVDLRDVTVIVGAEQ